jgi:hypothetical protein
MIEKVIDLIIKPGIMVSWEEFVASAPPFSIALDGYVSSGPIFDPSGPWQNFNHHDGVDRLATRATCSQVLLAVRQGLFRTFQKNKQHHAVLHINDPDEDVCLATFILSNYVQAVNIINPSLNKLVAMEDMLDTTGGAYAFPVELDSLRQLLWVFQPFHVFRNTGGLNRKDPIEYRSVIYDVWQRIQNYIIGNKEMIELDTTHEKIGGGDGWEMIIEQGPHARIDLFASRVLAFVSVKNLGNGQYLYTVGRSSIYVPFNVPRILAALNAAEGCAGNNRWGGGDLIGGSPRSGNSRLTPQEVEKIVNANK